MQRRKRFMVCGTAAAARKKIHHFRFEDFRRSRRFVSIVPERDKGTVGFGLTEGLPGLVGRKVGMAEALLVNIYCCISFWVFISFKFYSHILKA